MIELTRTQNHLRMSVDPDEIESVQDLNNYSNRPEQTRVTLKSGMKVIVTEKYQSIMDLINKE